MAIFLGLLLSATGTAQEIRYIDLSGVDQPTDRKPYGSRIENFSFGSSEKLFANRVRVSLEWLQNRADHFTVPVAAHSTPRTKVLANPGICIA